MKRPDINDYNLKNILDCAKYCIAQDKYIDHLESRIKELEKPVENEELKKDVLLIILEHENLVKQGRNLSVRIEIRNQSAHKILSLIKPNIVFPSDEEAEQYAINKTTSILRRCGIIDGINYIKSLNGIK